MRINTRQVFNILTGISTVACIAFFIYGIHKGIFYSENSLMAYMRGFGIWAPVFFVFFQAIQVVFPVLPGAIGCLGGVLAFGPIFGFVYNYIGICIGSVLAFLLSKRYGTALMKTLFSKRILEKYQSWTDNRKFDTLFAVAIFMPVAPDDFLCYLAGTTKMSLQKFSTIIILGKPAAIAIYSFGLNLLFEQVVAYFK